MADMYERILLLGVTGINKSSVLENLREYCKKQPGDFDFTWILFEDEYIKQVCTDEGTNFTSFLDATSTRQREYWLKAWNKFSDNLKSLENKHLILSLHGVFTRNVFGSRSPIDIPSIIKFSPTKIVTLIDNVYLKWHQTETRAQGSSKHGRPTLEELLNARRSEIVIGDIIAGHCSPKPKHFVLAVSHPVRTLFRLLFVRDDLKPIYLSFPISGPRISAEQNDLDGINEVNEFLKLANSFEVNNPKSVCFCPLTIDELPLNKEMKKFMEQGAEKQATTMTFDSKNMWDTTPFWGDEPLLSARSGIPASISLEIEDVKAAMGVLQADVRLRDYRLVQQSNKLAVFNPYFREELARGVRNELAMAGKMDLMCEIYQDQKHDSSKKANETFGPGEGGALGGNPANEGNRFHDSLEKLFKSL